MKVITLDTPQLEAAFIEVLDRALILEEEKLNEYEKEGKEPPDGDLPPVRIEILDNWSRLCEMVGAEQMFYDCEQLAVRYRTLAGERDN
jgi:hypothetical protein